MLVCSWSGPPNLKGGDVNFFFLFSYRFDGGFGSFFWTENFEGPCAPRAYRFNRGFRGAELSVYFVPITSPVHEGRDLKQLSN